MSGVHGGPTGPILAIEASSQRGSVAVIRDGVVVAERDAGMRGANGEWLMPAVAEALAEAGVAASELAGVVCGGGPGSFTSLRIGAAIAKGIAVGQDVPLYQLSSLLLVATGGDPLPAGGYLVVTDALRGEWFATVVRVAEDGAVSPEGTPARLDRDAVTSLALEHGLTLIGPAEDGDAERWPHARGAAPFVGALVAGAPVELESWEPDYGRLAEAQVKWEAAHGRALATG